jgi:hypothetical protein
MPSPRTARPPPLRTIGQFTRKDGVLLLIFDGDGKLERLTRGTDGRRFVERVIPAENDPASKPACIGIGIAQK